MKDLNPIALKRMIRGWNASDLASASGVSSGMVKHYEAGEHFPVDEKLTAICKTLGADFESMKAELHNWHDRKRPVVK